MVSMNQLIYYCKKAFKLFKRAKKQYDQHTAQQGGQQQQQQQQGGQAWGQQQHQQGSSPYPQTHQGQSQGGAWNQGHGQAQQGGKITGGYGSHDGPATNQDMANAQNSTYVDLRNQAIHEGDLMAKAFASSKQAYSSGNGAAAHDLSAEGKQHQTNKDRLNKQAAEWIFQENNRNQPQGSVDLHGLYVQEAIDFTERAINNARQQNLSELRVIVGKGNHSPSHVAKIKPAITSLMQRERLSAALDPHNGGVLIVYLQGQSGRSGGQFVREMEQNKDNDCTVM